LTSQGDGLPRGLPEPEIIANFVMRGAKAVAPHGTVVGGS
jgi:hypothetical protein